MFGFTRVSAAQGLDFGEFSFVHMYVIIPTLQHKAHPWLSRTCSLYGKQQHEAVNGSLHYEVSQ